MNKGRIEALSDGIFAVAMTLLVFDIKLPVLPPETATSARLWHELALVSPHILVYFGTFIVLSTMWINHHFLFQVFAKDETVDRKINLLNLIFLMLVAFVPFTASFIAEYPGTQPASVLYGANLLAIVFLAISIILSIHKTQGTEHLSTRILNQSRARSYLNIGCYVIGLAVSFLAPYVSLFFYVFPVIFNFIPGTLNFTERLLGLNLGEE